MSHLVIRSETGAFWNTLTFGVFFRGNMPGKLLMLAPLLLLTACRQEQLLPVAHAAGQEEFRSSVQQAHTPHQVLAVDSATLTGQPSLHAARKSQRFGLHDSCYAYMMQRPKTQRATAVQARLNKADAIEAAFSAQTMDVDLVGDHANVLAMQFPVIWPNNTYASRVSSVIEEYFSAPETLDYMCNAGFAEVRLLARGMNDGHMHTLWTAHVTAIGLVKEKRTAESLTVRDSTEQAQTAEAVSYIKPD
jgi:hypothetical protein